MPLLHSRDVQPVQRNCVLPVQCRHLFLERQQFLMPDVQRRLLCSIDRQYDMYAVPSRIDQLNKRFFLHSVPCWLGSLLFRIDVLFGVHHRDIFILRRCSRMHILSDRPVCCVKFVAILSVLFSRYVFPCGIGVLH